MNYNESNEQKSLMHWAKLAQSIYPDLKWLHCSLNACKRSAIQASIAKQQGMLAGVPDLFLPIKRGKYSGLFIEMKYGKNKATKGQLEFLENAKKNGYETAICYGWFEAKQILENYLMLK